MIVQVFIQAQRFKKNKYRRSLVRLFQTIKATLIQNVEFDLIIAGPQAINGDTAQAVPQIAEHLKIFNISYAEEIQVEDDYIFVKPQFEHRYHII